MGLVKKVKSPADQKEETANSVVKTDIIEIAEIAVSPKDGSITDKSGVVYILSELNSDLKPTNFQNGKNYTVEVLKGKGGTLYIQKLIKENVYSKEAETIKSTVAPYVDKRGNDIGNRGFIQAAVVAASNISFGGLESLEETTRKVLAMMDKLLEERNKQ